MEKISERAMTKFEIIQATISNNENLLTIQTLCEIARVSRSGFYEWRKKEKQRMEREEQDRRDFELILGAYQAKGYKKGYRSIYMRLLHQGIQMNPKKIRRLMNKYNLVCPIRKANPYKRMARAIQEEAVKGNYLKRQFKAYGPRKVLLTDITYLLLDNRKKMYLSTIKDGFTNEILSYVVSDSLELDFVLQTIHQLMEKHGITLSNQTLIHSDQGIHYTAKSFQELVKNKELRQSMSRRGNCWDNAPQESFFGHMKDEISLEGIQTLEETKTVIDAYIDYYNNDRYQWKLAKLAPTQYYHYFETGQYPLEKFFPAPALPEIRTFDEELESR